MREAEMMKTITTKITLPKELEDLTAKEIERVLRNWYGRKFVVKDVKA
ncbi:MAG: hypothetical protein ABIH09_02075 [Candidatus Omnitrophota bacterium]